MTNIYAILLVVGIGMKKISICKYVPCTVWVLSDDGRLVVGGQEGAGGALVLRRLAQLLEREGVGQGAPRTLF
jgi:hypothetical protein